MSLRDRISASMVGLAVGDALGHPASFVPTLAALRERFGPAGITRFEADGRHAPGSFTDDTQMAIAVARAICRAGVRDREAIMHGLGDELMAWSRSPLNNRAPSGTCLAACRNLARGTAWRDAGVKGSRGASSATRAAPVGMVLHRDDEALARIAAAQSAITHAHPTAVAASVAAAAAVAWALRDGAREGLVAHVRERVAALRVEDFVAVGCVAGVAEHVGARDVLDQLDRVAKSADVDADDACELFGSGRVGEEAIACALWCVLRGGGSFRATVLKAANTSGASDVIASIAGAVAGAYVGLDGIDASWRAGVESSESLVALGEALSAVAETGVACAPPVITDLFGADRFALRPEDTSGDEDTVVDVAPEALRISRLPTGGYAPVRR